MPTNSEISESVLESLSHRKVVADQMENLIVESNSKEGIDCDSLPVNYRLAEMVPSSLSFLFDV